MIVRRRCAVIVRFAGTPAPIPHRDVHHHADHHDGGGERRQGEQQCVVGEGHHGVGRTGRRGSGSLPVSSSRELIRPTPAPAVPVRRCPGRTAGRSAPRPSSCRPAPAGSSTNRCRRVCFSDTLVRRPLARFGFWLHRPRPPLARVGLTRARQASGIRWSGPPSPALPLELLTNGAVVPTGPQLVVSRPVTGIKLCPQPIFALRQGVLEHTEVGVRQICR
jgi:hypothetical protein